MNTPSIPQDEGGQISWCHLLLLPPVGYTGRSLIMDYNGFHRSSYAYGSPGEPLVRLANHALRRQLAELLAKRPPGWISPSLPASSHARWLSERCAGYLDPGSLIVLNIITKTTHLPKIF